MGRMVHWLFHGLSLLLLLSFFLHLLRDAQREAIAQSDLRALCRMNISFVQEHGAIDDYIQSTKAFVKSSQEHQFVRRYYAEYVLRDGKHHLSDGD